MKRFDLALAIAATTAIVLGGCGAGAAAPASTPAAAPASALPASAAAPAKPSATAPAASASAKPAASTASGNLKHIKIGALPTLGNAPLYIAQQKGYFKDEGLDAELVPFSSGAESIPPLAAGQVDAAASITPSAGLVNAVARGLPVRALWPTTAPSIPIETSPTSSSANSSSPRLASTSIWPR